MKDFNHPNVLGLLGVVFDSPNGTPYLVLPFMKFGSVKDYLKNKRVHITNLKLYQRYSLKPGIQLRLLYMTVGH